MTDASNLRRHTKLVALISAATFVFAACTTPGNAPDTTDVTTDSVVPVGDNTTIGGTQVGADVPAGSEAALVGTATFVGADSLSSVLSIPVSAGTAQGEPPQALRLEMITGSANAVRIGASQTAAVALADIASGATAIPVRPGTSNAVLVYTDPTTGIQQASAFTVLDPTWNSSNSTFAITAVPSVGGTIDRDMARLSGLALGTITVATALPASFANGTLYVTTEGLRSIGDCIIGPGAMCANADLFRADLVGVDMSGADLSFTNLGMSSLWDANFSNSLFVGAELFRADMSNSDLTSSNFSTADLSQAALTNTDFTNADLTETNMWRTELSGADISNADLTRAALQQSTLLQATARNVTMSGASMFRADISDADFTGARMNDVTMAQAIAQRTRFTGADLSHVDFSKADLKFADLSGANLTNAQLAGADLTGANLAGANLSGAVLWLADLTSANLSGVIWTGATCQDGNLASKQFYGVCWSLPIPQTTTVRNTGPLGTQIVGPRPDIARAGDYRDTVTGRAVTDRTTAGG